MFSMIDLETLDVKPDAAILTIGVVKFNPKVISTAEQLKETSLLIRLNVDEQFAIGRTYSEDTLAWWGCQAPEIQAAAFDGERMSLADGVDAFHKLVWGTDRKWSQGAFDFVILESLYRQVKRTPPWNYWELRDSRTLFDIVDGKLDRSGHHDAVEDAIQQALALQRALQKLNWKGERL